MQRVVPAQCPVCSNPIEFVYQSYTIPHFSPILIIATHCESCGYRFTDTQVLESPGPSRWELAVCGQDDLSSRVVRGMEGTIIIPELGVRIDPGPACEGFISNVEGVVARVEGVVAGVIATTDGQERDAAIAVQGTLSRARRGEVPFTLIIKDPSGNSAILADRAKRTDYDLPSAMQEEEMDEGTN
ncbi:MAG: ZPR1 zinc finger domain-containing protein [Methanomicrobiales archaeon]|nr:ZPR1 zinc finger domain-containing protein [Methanomicrobiales archaeon]